MVVVSLRAIITRISLDESFSLSNQPFAAAHSLFYYSDNATQRQRALGPVWLSANDIKFNTGPATDTIDYVATDQNGLTSTSTRTVLIEPSGELPPLRLAVGGQQLKKADHTPP